MSRGRLVGQHLAIAVAACLLLVGAFALGGMQPRPAWFVAVALAIAVGSSAVRLLGPQVIETSWPQRTDEAVDMQRLRSNDSRAQFLATWVQESGRDPQAFGHRVRPLLLELTSERLRRRHGIGLAAEPERARAILGEPHWALITDTTARTPSYGELEQAVRTIEEL